jgi:hypothetical protein
MMNWKEAVGAYYAIFLQGHEYSKRSDIRHHRDQRIVGYRNYPDIRTLYLMCILLYLLRATSWTDLTM